MECKILTELKEKLKNIEQKCEKFDINTGEVHGALGSTIALCRDPIKEFERFGRLPDQDEITKRTNLIRGLENNIDREIEFRAKLQDEYSELMEKIKTHWNFNRFLVFLKQKEKQPILNEIESPIFSEKSNW